jgi:hypothetical protein
MHSTSAHWFWGDGTTSLTVPSGSPNVAEAVSRGLLIGMHVPSKAIWPFGQGSAAAVGAPSTANAADRAPAAAESRTVRDFAARIAGLFSYCCRGRQTTCGGHQISRSCFRWRVLLKDRFTRHVGHEVGPTKCGKARSAPVPDFVLDGNARCLAICTPPAAMPCGPGRASGGIPQLTRQISTR